VRGVIDGIDEMTIRTIIVIKGARQMLSTEKGRSSKRGERRGKDAVWTVAEAKAHLSEVLVKARDEGPQTITRNGKQTAVVVGVEEWERKARRKGTLVEFLLASPLRNSGIELERDKEEPRDIDL
jgi:prevent-host-death family protein